MKDKKDERTRKRRGLAQALRLILWIAPLAVVTYPLGICCAQQTKGSTGEIPLDGEAMRPPGIPKPEFKMKDVSVKKTLTVDKQTGKVTQECKFINRSTIRREFLFCNMVALNSTFPEVDSTNKCNLKFTTVGTDSFLRCVRGSNSTRKTPPNFHFGCTEVRLGPGQMCTPTDVPDGAICKPTPASQMGQNPAFDWKEAKNFEVSYADIFNLEGAKFDDDGMCEALGCFGADSDTNLEGDIGRPAAAGFWTMIHQAIKDPFVVWQELNNFRHAPEYAPIAAGLSVPSEFPASSDMLGRTSPDTQPPLEFTQDLNLWDIFTMSDPPSVITPVAITPFFVDDSLQPNPGGVSVEVNPTRTNIVGGSIEFGVVTIRSPESVPEGTAGYLSVSFVDPRDPDTELWEQNGHFVQDTEPPEILGHGEEFGAGGLVLNVSITASDRTTSPVAANFWYSVDGGQEWIPIAMTGTADPFGEPSVNTFNATVEFESVPGAPIQFFYNVQDTVFNNVWFGVGTLLPPTP